MSVSFRIETHTGRNERGKEHRFPAALVDQIFPCQVTCLAVIEPDTGKIAVTAGVVKIDHDRTASADFLDLRDPAADITVDHQDLRVGFQEFFDCLCDHLVRFPDEFRNRAGADALHGISRGNEFRQETVITIRIRLLRGTHDQTGQFFVGISPGIQDNGPFFAVAFDQSLFAEFLQNGADGIASGLKTDGKLALTRQFPAGELIRQDHFIELRFYDLDFGH